MESSFVVARDELIRRLECMFFRSLYRYFGSVWLESELQVKKFQKATNVKEDEVIDIFRKKIGDVRNWTTTKINEEYEHVTQSKERLFDLLVTRTFTLSSRILSFAAEVPPEYIKISIPDEKRFVHAVYIAAARMFHMNPYLLSRRKTDPCRFIRNTEKCLRQVVSDTIRNLTCLEDIFLPQTKPISSVFSLDVPQFANFMDDTSPLTPLPETTQHQMPELQPPPSTDPITTKSQSIKSDDIKYVDKSTTGSKNENFKVSNLKENDDENSDNGDEETSDNEGEGDSSNME